jgi:hypothetical protein
LLVQCKRWASRELKSNFTVALLTEDKNLDGSSASNPSQ